jgi:uncharacterized membrane protein
MHQSRAGTMNVAADDVWPARTTDFAGVNLGRPERLFSVFSGALILFGGLHRRSLPLILGAGALLYRGISGYCPVYRALERFVGMPLTDGLYFEESIAVNKPVEQVYALWRHVENLPRFMLHLESVTPTYGNRSHWVARMPAPLRLEWDAAVTDEQENRRISWCSLPGSRVDHAGSVFFHSLPGRGGTEVKIIFKYKPPAGSAGAAAAKLLSLLTQNQIKTDLRAFKAVTETGERPTTVGQPFGQATQRNGATA